MSKKSDMGVKALKGNHGPERRRMKGIMRVSRSY